MQRRFQIAQALGQLSTRSEAWQFIRDFASEWVTPIAEAEGFTDAELDQAEERLHVRLPAAVREAYRLLGRRDDLTSAHGTLWGPDEWEYDPNSQLLVFRAAHQDVAFFGVSLADPAAEDPPVLYYATMYDKETEEWVPFLDRFSVACVDMVLWETIETGALSDGREPEPGEPASLIDGLNHVPFPGYRPGFDTVRWYASDDLILRDDNGGWVAVVARTEQVLGSFRSDHPGAWVNE